MPNTPYKLYNTKGCTNKTENSYFINEDLKILGKCHNTCKKCNGPNETQCTECYEGNILDKEGKCIFTEKCYQDCKECYQYSNNSNDQKCKSCIENKLYLEDKQNCVDNCPTEYYQNNNICKKCDESCLTCSNKKVNDNANCLSCKDNMKLIDVSNEPKNCVEECPEDTKVNNNKCIKSKSNYMLLIFYILIVLILFLIFVHIFKIFYRKKKNNLLIQPIYKQFEIYDSNDD